jgi:K+-sensing histidine kinase KdpD
MFEPCVQGAARTGSVGLGLVIVQAIVAAHGGAARIDVAAARRGIARLSFDVPLAPSPARDAVPVRRARRPAVPRLAVER